MTRSHSLAVCFALSATLWACSPPDDEGQGPTSATQQSALQAGTALGAQPTSLALIGPSGTALEYGTVTVTNIGSTFAGPLGTSLARVTGTGKDGVMTISANTCAGATLAPGGTCTVELEFSTACSKVSRTAQWNLSVSAPGATTVVVPATGTTIGGICQ